MKALRLPACACPVAYLFRYPGSARPSALRARLGGAPGWLEDPSGPGHLVSRPPSCRHTLTRTRAGSHRFPGYSRGFGTCCLRFTTGVAARRARLVSGWLADLYREGVEPSGSRRKVSELHVHPPLLSFPCRKDRQRQAGREDLAARGAEGPRQTIQARPHLACGWILHPTARRAAQPCLVL